MPAPRVMCAGRVVRAQCMTETVQHWWAMSTTVGIIFVHIKNVVAQQLNVKALSDNHFGMQMICQRIIAS